MLSYTYPSHHIHRILPTTGESQRGGIFQAHIQQFFDHLLNDNCSHERKRAAPSGYRSSTRPYVAGAVRNKTEKQSTRNQISLSGCKTILVHAFRTKHLHVISVPPVRIFVRIVRQYTVAWKKFQRKHEDIETIL